MTVKMCFGNCTNLSNDCPSLNHLQLFEALLETSGLTSNDALCSVGMLAANLC